MRKSGIAILALASAALALAGCSTGGEQAASGQASAVQPLPDPFVARADYSNDALWLCKPGIKDDKCKVNLDATIIEASGKTTVEKFAAVKKPEIDCFFVYPTVSLDPGYLSDWTPDAMEFDNVKLQLARFGSTCRTFAPLYRQFTLTALRASAGGAAPAGERPPANVGGYQDVLDAWNHYMANDNQGRGVVIMGHSQGAGLVARLIASEVEGKPAQKQFISGVILGSAVLVPEGKDTGGTYKEIPLCRAEDQTGCIISYATFRDTLPPPDSSRFGLGRGDLVAACNNPASLAGGKAVSDAYFMTEGFLNGSGGQTPPWSNPPKTITTPFVKVPGLVSTECVTRGKFSYLQMSVNADPADPRTDVVAGEVQRPTGPDLAWGLHLIDVDLTMGDLVRIVKKQAAAYKSRS
jgi:hypothetical protein